MTSTEATEGTMRRIQGLLRQAEDASITDEERQAFMEKADQLMAKHRLDRAILFASMTKTQKVQGREVVVDTIKAVEFTEFQGSLMRIRNAVYKHSGCALEGSWYGDVKVVGYQEDIDYANMMFTSVHMEFIRRIFPAWNSALGFDENVYNLKSAGYSWSQVREFGLAKNARDRSGPLTAANAGSKLRVAFKRHADKIGEVVLPGKQQPMNPQRWRRNFADSFASTIASRLYVMDRSNKEVAGKEGEIALRSDHDNVMERFWEEFPDKHPDVQRRRFEESDREYKRWWDSLSDAEKRREERKANRKYKTPAEYKYDEKAWAAGHKAGSAVRLTEGGDIANNNKKELS
jgi:hypothetical protein